MTIIESRRLLRSARSVLLAIPHENCHCYGLRDSEGQLTHYSSCIVGRAARLVDRINGALTTEDVEQTAWLAANEQETPAP